MIELEDADFSKFQYSLEQDTLVINFNQDIFYHSDDLLSIIKELKNDIGIDDKWISFHESTEKLVLVKAFS